MEPDNRNFVPDSLTEQGMELPPNLDDGDIDYVEEEEDDDEIDDEDDEEEGDEDEDEEDDDEDEEEEDDSGQLFANNIDDINSVTTSSQGDETASLKGDNGEYSRELNRGEVDGLFCPICFDGWSSGGDHHVCCLPCGHIYGLSCIKKWLERPGSSKCPQCKKKCRIKDIRQLYASRVVAIDEELQKKVQSLEAKCASLEKKVFESSKKEAEWKKKEVGLGMLSGGHTIDDVWDSLESTQTYMSERFHALEQGVTDYYNTTTGYREDVVSYRADLDRYHDDVLRYTREVQGYRADIQIYRNEVAAQGVINRKHNEMLQAMMGHMNHGGPQPMG